MSKIKTANMYLPLNPSEKDIRIRFVTKSPTLFWTPAWPRIRPAEWRVKPWPDTT
jgi:hypothetical protein